MLSFLAACAEPPAVGEIDGTASIALVQYETTADGYDGVVYRRVNRIGELFGQSEKVVLASFYSPMSPINVLIIPVLEQMAVDYQDRLQIIWIDAGKEDRLAESFGAETLPQFTIVIQGSPKRSLIGFDDEGSVRLKELVESYLAEP